MNASVNACLQELNPRDSKNITLTFKIPDESKPEQCWVLKKTGVDTYTIKNLLWDHYVTVNGNVPAVGDKPTNILVEEVQKKTLGPKEFVISIGQQNYLSLDVSDSQKEEAFSFNNSSVVIAGPSQTIDIRERRANKDLAATIGTNNCWWFQPVSLSRPAPYDGI